MTMKFDKCTCFMAKLFTERTARINAYTSVSGEEKQDMHARLKQSMATVRRRGGREIELCTSCANQQI